MVRGKINQCKSEENNEKENFAFSIHSIVRASKLDQSMNHTKIFLARRNIVI